MTTMMEKAARAAFDSDWPDCGPNDPEWIASKDTYLNNARAVLMAVRNLDDDEHAEILMAGRAVLPEFDEPLFEDAANCFSSIVDAVLNEEPR